MSGHSKWANIKHRKGAQDAKRAKVFTRILKEVTIAAREGGGDPETNPALRLAIQNGKGANLPKDNIERAIAKAVGGEGASLEEMTFEGYGPNGIAVFVETMSDNSNRTVANVRAIFTKFGGSLGTNGSLSFIFERKGIFTISKEKLGGRDLDELEMELIDGGMEDFERMDDGVMITVPFEEFGNMQKKFEDLKLEVDNAELQRIPNNTLALSINDSKTILKMIDKFDEDEDVNSVYHNMELTDELMAELELESD